MPANPASCGIGPRLAGLGVVVLFVQFGALNQATNLAYYAYIGAHPLRS